MRTGLVAMAGRLTFVAALAVTVAGCLDENVPSGAPTSAITPEPTPVTTVYELGSKVWYEGLVLTFDRVSATLDERGGLVDLLVGVANPGADAAQLSGKIVLVVGDVRVEPTRESQLPDVPGEGSVAAVLTYELQAIPSVDDAVIEIGTSPLHVARVPMTPRAGALVAYEPVALELAGSATASSLKITLRGGLLRWDLPDWSQELDADIAALTLTYDVMYVGSLSYGFPFTEANVALRLPDGTVVERRKDGHSQSLELIGPRKTKKNLFSRFEIPSDATGEFALLVRSGSTEKAIKFTIDG